MNEAAPAPTDPRDAWHWWEGRRLRYNIGLAIAGWLAYFTAISVAIAMGDPVPDNPRQVVSTTLLLGTGYLIAMIAANIAYLAGPIIETIVRPRDPGRFRARAWTLGFWGSMALPFAFPMVLFAVMFSLGPVD